MSEHLITSRRTRRGGPAMLLAITLSAGLTLAPARAAESLPPELAQIHAFLGVMQRYFELIDDVHQVTGSTEKSAIFQMHKLQEIYKDRGEAAKVAGEMRRVLDSTTNATLRNAAYMVLGDALKDAGRSDDALAVTRQALNENLKRLE